MNCVNQMRGGWYDVYATKERDFWCAISKSNFYHEQREIFPDFVIIDWDRNGTLYIDWTENPVRHVWEGIIRLKLDSSS